MQTRKKNTTDDTEIRIYDSLKRALLLFVGCLIFVTGGVFVIADDGCRPDVKLIAGWLNCLFFGLGGLLMLGSTLYKRIRCIPSLIIRDDCVCIYVQMKNKYDVSMFRDIERFRLTKLYNSKMILIDYKPMAIVNEFDKSSPLVRQLMAFNLNKVNALKGISTANLATNTEKLCAILNGKLTR